MKRAFVLDHGNLASALVPLNTQDTIHLGDRFTVSRDIDAGYGAQIAKGERCTIDHIDAPTGSLEVLMDTPHKGLREWDNHILLVPFGSEDIEGSFRSSTRACALVTLACAWSSNVVASALVALVGGAFVTASVPGTVLLFSITLTASIIRRLLVSV